MGSGASLQSRQEADNKMCQATWRPRAPTYNCQPAPYMNLTDLPPQLILRVDGESLTILNAENNMPLRHFAYYTILSWGSSPETFQWKVFNRPDLPPGSERNRNTKTFGIHTKKGLELEKVVLKYVKILMADMAKRGISDDTFKGILGQISMDQRAAAIRDVPSHNAFTIHQCVSLMRLVEKICPFEKLDVAILLYDRMLNRDSFQLVVNCFDTIQDRENLCYRLKIPITGGLNYDPEDARERERARKNNFPAICVDCLSGLS